MSRVAYLVCTKDLCYAKFFQAVLPVACTFILADHFGRHPVFMTLDLKVGIQGAKTAAVLLDLDFFKAFFEDGRANLREELSNV